MAFTKAKIVMAGLAVTAVCIVAPQQLKAQVPEAQMDGVMGQSIEDETVYESKPDLDTLIECTCFRESDILEKSIVVFECFFECVFYDGR